MTNISGGESDQLPCKSPPTRSLEWQKHESLLAEGMTVLPSGKSSSSLGAGSTFNLNGLRSYVLLNPFMESKISNLR